MIEGLPARTWEDMCLSPISRPTLVVWEQTSYSRCACPEHCLFLASFTHTFTQRLPLNTAFAICYIKRGHTLVQVHERLPLPSHHSYLSHSTVSRDDVRDCPYALSVTCASCCATVWWTPQWPNDHDLCCRQGARTFSSRRYSRPHEC